MSQINRNVQELTESSQSVKTRVFLFNLIESGVPFYFGHIFETTTKRNVYNICCSFSFYFSQNLHNKIDRIHI